MHDARCASPTSRSSAHEEADGEAPLTLVASGEHLSFFTESTEPFVKIGAV